MVGLLLLLGLFWYWASTLIGDDSDNGNDVTPTVAIVIDSTETATATVTVESGITPTETTNQPAGETPTTESGNAEETPTEEATEETTSASDRFAENDEVTVNDDNVNLRADATTDSEALEVLSTGQSLTITGPAVEADGYTWWPVDDVENDIQGYVADEYLDASS